MKVLEVKKDQASVRVHLVGGFMSFNEDWMVKSSKKNK